MFKLDTLSIEILEDGTIKTLTDAVSPANHANAEQFLQFMAKLAGGETTRAKRTDTLQAQQHAHSLSDSDKEQQ